MLGEEIWAVTIQGKVFKGGLSRREAERMAQRYQVGTCREKDTKVYVDIQRDTTLVKEMDERYQTYKRKEPQTHHFYQGG